MKGIILEALKYPQSYIRQQIEIDGCLHGGNYNPHDPQCLDCQTRYECEWVNHNDESSALNQHSTGDLINALEFSLEYIDGKIADMGHKIKDCQCDNCKWMRQADRIYIESYRANIV